MTLPLAQSGWTFLLYLVVGIFWLVGNIWQQKEAKRKAAEMRRRREEREREEARTGKKAPKPHPVESDLETFLKRLSGEPATPPKRETPPPVRRPEPEIQWDTSPPPPPPPRRTPPPAAPAPAPEPKQAPATAWASSDDGRIGDLDMADSYKEMAELEEAVEISYDQLEGEVRQQALDTVRQVRIDLSPTTLDMPRVPTPSLRAVQTRADRPNVFSRKGFKKAVAASVILEPPAALRDPNGDGR